jgi:hypothetical protein
MARKYGDLIEVRNCISLGISNIADTIRAIYVSREDIYRPQLRYELERRALFLREEDFPETDENNPFVAGHNLYIRPEDKPLLTFTGAADRNIYWLLNYSGITKNFKTIYSDTPDIVVGDYVVKRGSSSMYKVMGRSSWTGDTDDARFLIMKLGKNDEEYDWFEETGKNKIFKISRRNWY